MKCNFKEINEIISVLTDSFEIQWTSSESGHSHISAIILIHWYEWTVI